jgi:adenylate cyclase
MVERKLVTILSADVAEYSRLMAEDEEQTLRIFREHSQTFQSLVDLHHGRIFNTAGDAILAEFTSPVEAVRCATEIQAALRTRNEQFPPNRQVKFRIGINVGDVMVQNSDLLGDGVNVAARLQGAAAPGGICISGTVYDQIRNKLTLGFESLGERRFKNIPQPVRTFTISGGDEDGGLRPSKNQSGRTGLLVTIAALLLLVLAGGYWAFSMYRQGQQITAVPKMIEKAPPIAGLNPLAVPAPAKTDTAPAATKSAAMPAAETPIPQAHSGPDAASDISRLMRSEEMASNRCTDGSGDLDETGRACAERDRLVELLADKGWCYQRSWQRCAR